MGGGGVGVNLKPLADRVIVRVIEAEEKTKGGIVLPDTAKERPQEGEVLAVGSGRRLDDGTVVKPQVKVGDKVLFSKYGGTEVKLDGTEYLIMREEDILGIL
jgi:chaperonin GroES